MDHGRSATPAAPLAVPPAPRRAQRSPLAVRRAARRPTGSSRRHGDEAHPRRRARQGRAGPRGGGEADGPIDVAGVLARLRPSNTRGASSPHVDGFVGASPELLVGRSGDVVGAQPMAGTAARGATRRPTPGWRPPCSRRPDLPPRAPGDDRHGPRHAAAVLLLPRLRGRAVGRPVANVQHLATLVEGRLSQPPPRCSSWSARCTPPRRSAARPRGGAGRHRRARGFRPRRYAGTVGWVDGAATARGPSPSAAPRSTATGPPVRRQRHRRRLRPRHRARRDPGQVPGHAQRPRPAVILRRGAGSRPGDCAPRLARGARVLVTRPASPSPSLDEPTARTRAARSASCTTVRTTVRCARLALFADRYYQAVRTAPPARLRRRCVRSTVLVHHTRPAAGPTWLPAPGEPLRLPGPHRPRRRGVVGATSVRSVRTTRGGSALRRGRTAPAHVGAATSTTSASRARRRCRADAVGRAEELLEARRRERRRCGRNEKMPPPSLSTTTIVRSMPRRRRRAGRSLSWRKARSPMSSDGRARVREGDARPRSTPRRRCRWPRGWRAPTPRGRARRTTRGRGSASTTTPRAGRRRAGEASSVRAMPGSVASGCRPARRRWPLAPRRHLLPPAQPRLAVAGVSRR